MQGPLLRKYGAATIINFDLFEVDGVDFRVDAIAVTGDVKIMKDEGAEADTATTTFVDEGQGYSQALSATEMQAARVVIYFVDQTATKAWLDKSIIIETYGNASAQHAFDLDTAVQDVNIASSDDIDLTVTQKASVNAEADQALTDYDAVIPADLNDPTAAVIADAVLNELTADHTGVGSLSKAIIDILEDTVELQTDNLPGTLSTINGKLPASLVGGRIDATVDATGFEQGAIDNIWDEPLTGSSHNAATSAGKRLRQTEAAFIHANGTIATVTNGHTFTLDAGAVATADLYINDRLEITEGTGVGQSRLIVAYSVGRVAILDSDFTTNPDTSSLYAIIAADVHVSLSDSDLAQGFVAVATNTTTITLDARAVGTPNYYKGDIILFTHGPGAGQSREIVGYTNGRVVTMAPALETALSTDTVYHIQAAVDISKIVDDVWDEAQSDHVIAGSFGVIASEIASIPTTAMRGTDDAALASVATEGRLAELDAGNMPSDIDAIPTTAMRGTDGANTTTPPTVSAVADGILDEALSGHVVAGSLGKAVADTETDAAAILVDTNELQTDNLPGLIAALNDLAGSDILTTALTEAYAADGVAPTLSELMYMIWSVIQEFGISGTTLSSKKLDSTEAMTWTLDDATNPTSRVRAT